MEITYRELIERGYEKDSDEKDGIFPLEMRMNHLNVSSNWIQITLEHTGDGNYQVNKATDYYGNVFNNEEIQGPGRFQNAKNLDELVEMLSNPSYSRKEIRREKMGRPLSSDYNPRLSAQGEEILYGLLNGEGKTKIDDDDSYTFYNDVYGEVA